MNYIKFFFFYVMKALGVRPIKKTMHYYYHQYYYYYYDNICNDKMICVLLCLCLVVELRSH